MLPRSLTGLLLALILMVTIAAPALQAYAARDLVSFGSSEELRAYMGTLSEEEVKEFISQNSIEKIREFMEQHAPATTTPFLPGKQRQQNVPEGLASCFEYYTFGSVAATVTAYLASAVQGGEMAFFVTLENENSYPVVDAQVYAKLFKTKGPEKDVNGPDVVAFFPIGGKTTLSAGESKEMTYSWVLPKDLQPGDYQIATYVVANDRFNFRGLTFTDDVVGDIYNFSVVGEDSGAVRFDKSRVSVNGRPFYFAAFPPQVPEDAASVPVAAVITNTRTTSETVALSWRYSRWDGLRDETVIEEKQQQVEVPAGGTANVLYAATLGNDASMYYLSGTLTTESGNTSFINVRFSKGGVNVPRLNDVAVNAYPGAEGTTAFACFHSTGTGAAKDGKVILSVRKAGWGPLDFFAPVLASATYEGVIPGEVYALTAPFAESATSFDVTTELYQGGKLIDKVTVPYRCDTLGEACGFDVLPWAVGGIVFLIVVVGILISRRRTPPAITTA